MSRAYQLEKAARVAMSNYLWIAVGVFSDLYLFDSAFSWLDILGCVLIVGVSFVNILLKAVGLIE